MALPPLPPGALDVTPYFDGSAPEGRFTADTGLRPAFVGDKAVHDAYKRGGADLAMAYTDSQGTLYTLHTVFGGYLQTGPNSYREERRFELRPLVQ